YYIPDPSVSRSHCEIIVKEGKVRIRDLDSKNGTIINYRFVKDAYINEGDIIKIGNLQFVAVVENDVFVLERQMNEEGQGMKDGQETPWIGSEQTKHVSVEQISRKETDQVEQCDGQLPDTQGEASAKLHANTLKKMMKACREKLGSEALFLIELTEIGSLIRAESTGGSYVLSSTVINYMKEMHIADRMLKRKLNAKKPGLLAAEESSLKGLWAPREMKDVSQSLLGVAENSIYCIPVLEEEKVIIMYAYWIRGCPFPERAEQIILKEGKEIALYAQGRLIQKAEHDTLARMESLLSEPLIGSSPVFLSTLEQACKVARTDFSVVLLGPRGCGKTTIARAIHEMSHRKRKPFVAFNCANFMPNILESELFGSRRGAFTGAVDRTGYLMRANGGTIFVDSIESCPLEIQAKLRDVLEGRSFYPVGSRNPEKVDVRFLAAINENPVVLAKENRLQHDFWDRIGVQFIKIPPLWQRISDIPELAFYFLERERKKCFDANKKLKGFSPEAMQALQSYYWPGNVRELCNVISRLLIYANNEFATEKDVTDAINILLDVKDYSPFKSIFELPFHQAHKMFMSLYMQKKMEEAGNKKARAAKLAKLSRGTFYNILKRCKISSENE
ncbi:MAG: hypothetical protein A2Y62_16645, partial [Candidatus Fischerbacteria bacterium RBG_13_37_8]